MFSFLSFSLTPPNWNTQKKPLNVWGASPIMDEKIRKMVRSCESWLLLIFFFQSRQSPHTSEKTNLDCWSAGSSPCTAEKMHPLPRTGAGTLLCCCLAAPIIDQCNSLQLLLFCSRHLQLFLFNFIIISCYLMSHRNRLSRRKRKSEEAAQSAHLAVREFLAAT